METLVFTIFPFTSGCIELTVLAPWSYTEVTAPLLATLDFVLFATALFETLLALFFLEPAAERLLMPFFSICYTLLYFFTLDCANPCFPSFEPGYRSMEPRRVSFSSKIVV